MAVKPIPDGYHTATPYLIIKNAGAALDFYRRAFGAVELMRLVAPTGEVGHAEIRIGYSVIMLADEMPNMGFRSPSALGGSPVSILLYLENVDERFKQAVDAGAKVVRPLQDQFYGDRPARWKIPSVMFGRWQSTSKMCRRKRSTGAPRRS